MWRVFDRNADGEQMDQWFRWLVLVHAVAWLENEYCPWNNMVTAAEAAISARLIASGTMARGAGSACIRYVAGTHLDAGYKEQENSNDAQ